MPQFIPLRFYHYNWQDSRIEPEKVISPPYDVLSADDIQGLAGQDFNVVHLDSPASYRSAALKIVSWIDQDVLQRDPEPRFYIMATDYFADQKKKTRWGVFGGLKIHAFDDRKIFPHEQTYSKAKDDRLNLMKATRGQLSPIFGIYSDPELTLEQIGKESSCNGPIISFSQEPGVFNRIWPLKKDYTQAVEKLMLDKKIFIADGHHRYETALNYKNMMPGSENAPWNHVFAYLSNIASTGLEIFPYHRILSREKTFDWNRVAQSAENDFDVMIFDRYPDSFEHGRSDSFILYAENRWLLFTPKAAPQDTFFRIGAYVLDRLFLRKAMGLTDEQLATGAFLSYTHNQADVISRVDAGYAGAGFILKPVPMDVLQDVCESGQVMPRKSTYFYPKLPTGALFHLWSDRID